MEIFTYLHLRWMIEYTDMPNSIFGSSYKPIQTVNRIDCHLQNIQQSIILEDLPDLSEHYGDTVKKSGYIIDNGYQTNFPLLKKKKIQKVIYRINFPNFFFLIPISWYNVYVGCFCDR